MFSLGPYEGAARRAVIALKERGRRELAVPLGKALADALPVVTEADNGVWLLVPAPSRPAAVRRRGGSHMALVAERCAEALTAAGHAARVHSVLRLASAARDSVGLDPAERAANLAGRLSCVGASPGPGTGVILLDDVITTGSTAAACSAALNRTGLVVKAVLACTATG